VSATFDNLVFAPTYQVTVDPEFPPDGVWGEQVRHFHPDQRCDGTEPFRSKWGPPLVLRVEPQASDAWVGFVESGGLHRSQLLVSGPGSQQLVAVNGGCAYLIDVLQPMRYEVAPASPILRAEGVTEPALLLLVTFTDLVAIDPVGLLWRTDRLVLDDLMLVGATRESIVVRGSTLEGGVAQVTLDPRTGLIVSDSAPMPDPLRQQRHWLRPD
jgi:hypothetical protein